MRHLTTMMCVCMCRVSVPHKNRKKKNSEETIREKTEDRSCVCWCIDISTSSGLLVCLLRCGCNGNSPWNTYYDVGRLARNAGMIGHYGHMDFSTRLPNLGNFACSASVCCSSSCSFPPRWAPTGWGIVNAVAPPRTRICRLTLHEF